jgi:hypothetical protein
MCSQSDLQRHYRTSLFQPLSVGAFLAAHGLIPSWPAPPRLHNNDSPRFASIVDSHPYRLHPNGPGWEIPLHRGVWTAPSPPILLVAMGYPLDVLCSRTLSNTFCSALLG